MAALLFSLACVALAFGLGGIYLTKEPGPTAIGNLLAAGILFLVAIVVSFVSVRRRQVGLSQRVFVRAFLQAVAAVLITGGIIAGASRLRVEWDLTEPRTYTLSEFSHRILKELPVDVEAVYVGDPAKSGQERLLIERFAQASDHFHLRIVSPQELGPEAARQLERTGSQLILHSGGRARRVPALSERYILQTVLEFSTRATTTLCFLSGHGEPPLDGHGAKGLSTLRGMLELEGFRTSDLVLATQAGVPDSCNILVIAAPERNLLPAEQESARSFLSRGGRLLVFAEPGRPLEPKEILEENGISALDAIVLDEEASLFGSEAKGTEPIVNRFTDYHPVAQGLTEQTGVVFSGACPLILRGAEPRGFVYSDRTSRVEWPAEEDGQGHPPSPKILPPWMRGDKGPFPLGATVQWPTDSGKEARIAVFGDIDFATNRLIGALYNEDLVLNAVYYLANREDEILIRPKVEDLYQAPLIPESTFAAFHSVALLIPEAILIFGLIVWFRRRRL